ncbi:hypothetical protein KC19_7G081100 [Ceratodon purpureus]|uniref:Alpha 1,4-glycosyltransferase domain-containing protein n=1 Tax=Ceratodon purpureus TaxID=3225 RepID=A0A8T0H3P7_CERPU|nr:hypothetical protein KC19_7G081100 [Ceratodon purpureus]KAG0566681.1 hypothetical protein KC19_7G081100 [Ceratodon purpureus]
MCIAICVVGDSKIRSMEALSSGSPAKEPSRNSWRRKTNIFVAMPTLLTLYFIGAGVAFVICTRTFVSFHIFSHESQAPVQLFRMNSTYLPGQGSVLVPEKPALEVIEELQAPPHTLRDRELGIDVFKANTTTTNASSSQTPEQPDFDPADDQEAIPADLPPVEEFDTEPEFMQNPTVKKSKVLHAAVLQHRLKRMSSMERRRWLHENWSVFKILKEDNLSNQFSDRMQEFFCNNNITPHLSMLPNSSSSNSTPSETLQTQADLHDIDEANICKPQLPSNPAFCTERFFLTWMSPVSSFTPRERLGLESIFKHQPNACVVILSRTMDSDAGRKILAPFVTRGYRIMAVTPDLPSLFADLPAAKWLNRLRDGTGDPGCINLMQNLSNIMRLAALYKYGGVYLDTDVIVLKSFAELRNVVGTQSKNAYTGHWTRLNNAVLVFDRAHPIVYEFLREFVDTFDGSRWGWNGPYLVSRVVDKVLQVQKWANCSDVAVLPLQAFYPVNWIDIVKFFQKPTEEREIKWQAKEVQWIQQGTYSIHLWNKRSNHLKVQQGSIMETLFKRACLFCKQVAGS